MQYKFHTSLGKEECIKILSDKTNPDNPAGQNAITGKVDGDNFYFEMFGAAGIKGMRPISKRFKGTLQATANGTDILGTFVRSSGSNFLTLMIGGVFLFFLIYIAIGIIKNTISLYGALFLLILPPVLIYSFIPQLKKKENLDFIKNILEAQEIP